MGGAQTDVPAPSPEGRLHGGVASRLVCPRGLPVPLGAPGDRDLAQVSPHARVTLGGCPALNTSLARGTGVGIWAEGTQGCDGTCCAQDLAAPRPVTNAGGAVPGGAWP